MDPINPNDQGRINDLHFQRLREVLETKCRGDTISALEIREATGLDDLVPTLRRRIRKFFRERGMVAKSVPGNGYRVLSLEDQPNEGIRHGRLARGHNRVGLEVIAAVPKLELSATNRRIAEFVENQMRRSCELDALHEKELKFKLALTAGKHRY